MRTRRSPRNQERLWRYLTPPVPTVPKPEVRAPLTADEIRAHPIWSARLKQQLLRDLVRKTKRT